MVNPADRIRLTRPRAQVWSVLRPGHGRLGDAPATRKLKPILKYGFFYLGYVTGRL
jgi:hypothetical protein